MQLGWNGGEYPEGGFIFLFFHLQHTPKKKKGTHTNLCTEVSLNTQSALCNSMELSLFSISQQYIH